MTPDQLTFWVQTHVVHLIGDTAVYLANHLPFGGYAIMRGTEFFANDLIISGALPFAIAATAAGMVGPVRERAEAGR